MRQKIVISLFCSLLSLQLTADITNEIVHKAMSFKLEDVIVRYQKDYKVSDETAHEHARELKRYLSLCSMYPTHNFHMFSKEVDNLWHTFIMHTKKYMHFCDEVAGRYLHHAPIDDEAKKLYDSCAEKRKFIEMYTVTFNENPPVHIWASLDACTSDCKEGGCSANCGSCVSGCLVR